MVASSYLKMVLHAAFLLAATLPKSKAESLDPRLSTAIITKTVWTTNCSVEEATTVRRPSRYQDTDADSVFSVYHDTS